MMGCKGKRGSDRPIVVAGLEEGHKRLGKRSSYAISGNIEHNVFKSKSVSQLNNPMGFPDSFRRTVSAPQKVELTVLFVVRHPAQQKSVPELNTVKRRMRNDKL